MFIIIYNIYIINIKCNEMAVQKSKNTKRFYKNINNLYKTKLLLQSKTFKLQKSKFNWISESKFKTLINY